MAANNWPIERMYNEFYSPLGYKNKWDYWDCHENNEIWWFYHDPFYDTHFPELLNEINEFVDYQI